MKKRIWLFPLLILASLLLTGCALQTVDEMYALPKPTLVATEEFLEGKVYFRENRPEPQPETIAE